MEQFDIKEFAQMFDAALASDNPTVKKALRNFMMVAAIVHAEEQNGEERLMGPLETLVKKVADLEAAVYKMQVERTTTKDYYKDYYTNPWSGTPYITSTTSTTSGTTYYGKSIDNVWADEYSDLRDVLKDLKIK
jgi:thioesterase domain-containing protein